MSEPFMPDNPSDAWTEGAAWRVASRTVLLVFALLLTGWLVVQLRNVLILVLLAIIFSAGMTPLVNSVSGSRALHRWGRGPSRAVAVLLVYVTFVVVVTLLGFRLLPPLIHEIEELIRGLPSHVTELQTMFAALNATYPGLPDLNATLGQTLRAAAAQLSGVVGQALAVARFVLTLVSGTLDAFFILILALYITVDTPRIAGFLVGLLPDDRQYQAHNVARQIGLRFGGWVRGQILLSIIIGSLTFVGLSILGVRYAVLLSIIAAVGEVIPVVGPIISAVPAVIIASIQSPLLGLLTAGLYLVIQQLENHLIVPRVMARAVSLHPLAVLLALLVGSELLGVAGAVLSVPVTAALSVIIEEVQRERRRRRVALTEPLPAPADPAGSG